MAKDARKVEPQSDSGNELTGMRVAILAETLYEDLELWYPYYRLREAGADVFVVGSGSAETYQSKHGYPVTVDAEADTVTASQFDAVIVPGGYSPDHMRRHPGMVNPGANWVDREVVRDGNMITSRSPADLPAFMRTVVAALRERRREAAAPEQ